MRVAGAVGPAAPPTAEGGLARCFVRGSALLAAQRCGARGGQGWGQGSAWSAWHGLYPLWRAVQRPCCAEHSV